MFVRPCSRHVFCKQFLSLRSSSPCRTTRRSFSTEDAPPVRVRFVIREQSIDNVAHTDAAASNAVKALTRGSKRTSKPPSLRPLPAYTAADSSATGGWIGWAIRKLGYERMEPVSALYASVLTQAEIANQMSALCIPQTVEHNCSLVVLHVWLLHVRFRQTLLQTYQKKDTRSKRFVFWYIRSIFKLMWDDIRQRMSDGRTLADVKVYLDDCQAQMATYDTAWKHMTQRENVRRHDTHTTSRRHDADHHHLMIAALWRNVYNADSQLPSSALTSLMSYIQCQLDRLSQWSDNEVFDGLGQWAEYTDTTPSSALSRHENSHMQTNETSFDYHTLLKEFTAVTGLPARKPE